MAKSATSDSPRKTIYHLESLTQPSAPQSSKCPIPAGDGPLLLAAPSLFYEDGTTRASSADAKKSKAYSPSPHAAHENPAPAGPRETIGLFQTHGGRSLPPPAGFDDDANCGSPPTSAVRSWGRLGFLRAGMTVAMSRSQTWVDKEGGAFVFSLPG